MVFIYNIVIRFYYIAIVFSGLFHKKAKLFLDGRKNTFRELELKMKEPDKIAWFHAASLGEFEQGRPVIEAFRHRHPDFKILLTFFSPSGYEVRKNYPGADYIYYLPFDFRANAEKFIATVKPRVVFFIKYEYWFNYLDILNSKNIPVLIFSAIYRQDQVFFRWYGSLFRKLLTYFNHIFVQDDNSKQLLSSIGIHHVTESGDTRFDRVSEIASVSMEIPVVRKFAGNNTVVVAGSSWQPDEEILAAYINSQDDAAAVKFIIAPHEIKPANIERIRKGISKKTTRFSEASLALPDDCKVLIIDNIGMLSALYKYGHIAFIGGGFGKGIHNTLEAAAFGNAILFGPNYHKFREARGLIAVNAATVVHNFSDFKFACDAFIHNAKLLDAAALEAKNFVADHTGGVDRILDYTDKLVLSLS